MNIIKRIGDKLILYKNHSGGYTIEVGSGSNINIHNYETKNGALKAFGKLSKRYK